MEEIARPEKPSLDWWKDIVKMWETITSLEIEVRSNFLKGEANIEPINNLISLLTTLWGKIYPKVRGTEFEENFEKFKDFYFNPAKLLNEENFPKIFDFILTLGIVLENLGITQFEQP